MNKTTKEKFEEILSILQLNYKIQYDGIRFATVSDCYTEPDKCLKLELNEDSFSVYEDENNIQVLSLDEEAKEGYRVIDVENILIRHVGLTHGPITLSVYLYCRLLGILWGIKASAALRDQNPLPDSVTFVELKGRSSDGIWYTYHYYVCTNGQIIVEKCQTETAEQETFEFMPEKYLEDPEQTVMEFFRFFEDIKEIESTGKG